MNQQRLTYQKVLECRLSVQIIDTLMSLAYIIGCCLYVFEDNHDESIIKYLSLVCGVLYISLAGVTIIGNVIIMLSDLFPRQFTTIYTSKVVHDNITDNNMVLFQPVVVLISRYSVMAKYMIIALALIRYLTTRLLSQELKKNISTLDDVVYYQYKESIPSDVHNDRRLSW